LKLGDEDIQLHGSYIISSVEELHGSSIKN